MPLLVFEMLHSSILESKPLVTGALSQALRPQIGKSATASAGAEADTNIESQNVATHDETTTSETAESMAASGGTSAIYWSTV